MELKDVTILQAMQAMDLQAPDWELQWADQRDLQDAMRLTSRQRKDFLQARARGKVALVLRAALVVTMAGGV